MKAKICPTCKKEKERTEFYSQSNRSGGIGSYCKQCIKQKSAMWYSENKGKVREYRSRTYKNKAERNKRNNLMSNYGMTVEDWNALFKAQDGCCDLCKKPFESDDETYFGIGKRGPKGTKPVVDHDHDTEKVRALLHSKCNRALGLFEDNSQILYLAYLYLRKHGK